MNKIENTRILVTGGAGFVGSYIIEMLLEMNPLKVVIVDNMIRGTQRNMQSFIKNSKIEFVEADIRNFDLMERLISNTDYIFHLAALRINRCAENQMEAFDVMANATFNIIELAKKHKVKKIIYSSTASVYGLAQNFPTPESDNPYDNKTFYGAIKLLGESMLKSYHDMHGLDYIALRYFNIYGPRMDTEGKYTEVMIKWLDCIDSGKAPLIYGDGSTSMDFVHVEDVAKANIAALESEISNEVFNVGCQRETSLAELLGLLLEANDSSLLPDHRPDNSINPVSRRLADVSKIEKAIGFKPSIDLEDGLRSLSKWYFSVKGLVY